MGERTNNEYEFHRIQGSEGRNRRLKEEEEEAVSAQNHPFITSAKEHSDKNVNGGLSSRSHGEKVRNGRLEFQENGKAVISNRANTPESSTVKSTSQNISNDTKISCPSGFKDASPPDRPSNANGPDSDAVSISWAFTSRASIVPSKFDHMAMLKTAYSSYKEKNGGNDAVPVSVLPELLESARFLVPPPQDLVPLLQRLDKGYEPGQPVGWSLLQQLALKIEHKQARYPSVFNPRFSTMRTTGTSPIIWKSFQRSPSRRTHPEDDIQPVEPQVYNMMEELETHRRKSVKEGNYLAADAAAQRLVELKLLEENKKRASMLERHAQEREQAERAYQEELQERNQIWDDRMKSFQKEVAEHAQRLKRHQAAVLNNFKDKMAAKAPSKPQCSKELLVLRKVQSFLVKQGKYVEAEEMKKSGDRMERGELQATRDAFHTEASTKEQALRVKQQTELEILLSRADRTREEIRKSRMSDLQRCHQRHKNIMRELTAIQRQEVFRFDQLMDKKIKNINSGFISNNSHQSQIRPSSFNMQQGVMPDDSFCSSCDDLDYFAER